MTHVDALIAKHAGLLDEADMTMIDRACLVMDWAMELAEKLDALEARP